LAIGPKLFLDLVVLIITSFYYVFTCPSKVGAASVYGCWKLSYVFEISMSQKQSSIDPLGQGH